MMIARNNINIFFTLIFIFYGINAFRLAILMYTPGVYRATK